MASPADTTADVILQLKNWAKQPYQTNMNLGGWFMFIGAIIAVSAAWGLILHDLKGEL